MFQIAAVVALQINVICNFRPLNITAKHSQIIFHLKEDLHIKYQEA